MGLNIHQANGNHRRTLLRSRWVLLALLAALLGTASTVRAQDPVEKLRQALILRPGDADGKIDVLEKRRKSIEASIAELHTVAELRRAYFLKEWVIHAEIDKIDKNLAIERYRIEIADRFAKTINGAAKDPDPDIRIAIASLIAEMADADQSTDRKGLGKFARVFTKTAIGLAADENILVRQYALSALGKITPKPGDVTPVLKKALTTDALGPRRFAAYALGDLVKNAAYLRPVEDEQKRIDENEELTTIEQAINVAVDGLGHSDERTRGYCLQAIVESAKALTDYLGSSSLIRDVKGKKQLDRSVNGVLNAIQAANPLVLERVKDSKVNVRLTALQAMDQIGIARMKLIRTLQDLAFEKTSTPALFKSVEATDPLGNVVAGDWKHIAAFLKDEDPRIRRGAIEILEQLGEQVGPAAEDVTRALHDPDRSVRWTAVRTMRHLEPESISSSAVRALSAMLSDPDADLSAAAIDALSEMGKHASEAVEALVFSVADGDVENRIKAMNALIRIGGVSGERATPKLIEALNDSEVRIRRAAAETLGRFGPAAKGALPALRIALRDNDAAVRLYASEAILSFSLPRKKS